MNVNKILSAFLKDADDLFERLLHAANWSSSTESFILWLGRQNYYTVIISQPDSSWPLENEGIEETHWQLELILLLNISSVCLTIWVMFLLTSHQCQAALWTVSIEKLPTSVCTEGQLPILASFNLLILLHLPVKRIHFNPRQAQELKKENLGKPWVKKTLPRHTAVISPLTDKNWKHSYQEIGEEYSLPQFPTVAPRPTMHRRS